MERLTSNKHIVSGYGFCGNTVLTEFAGSTLNVYLNPDKKKKHKKEQEEPMEEPSKGKIETVKTKRDQKMPQIVTPSRYNVTNPMYKVELALDVMKGLKAMHDLDIVHADIQSKQFLLDPVEGIKLNDFNRCRLLPKHKDTGEICKVKIPSAPGGNRSPEEYELYKIDTKIDIFSTGNVLFNILTGEEPWGRGVMKLDVQRNVKKGILPEISEEYRKPGTIDNELAELVIQAFAFKPENRWTAAQFVDKLEKIKKEYSVPR